MAVPTRRPIVIIENDPEDQEILATAYNKLNLPYPIRAFENATDALAFLRQRNIFPFLVISDINMPGMNGFQLRDKVLQDDDLRTKCIPYIFLTDSSSLNTAIEAYSRSVQGLFTKPDSEKQLTSLLATIVDYWHNAISPIDQQLSD